MERFYWIGSVGELKYMNPKTIKKLEKLYNALPKIECKGLCSETCGPITMTYVEARRVKEMAGIDEIPKVDSELNCGLLKDSRCSVYEVRPAICRLWGLVDKDGMRCPFGCIPNRWLTDAQGRKFLDEVDAVGSKGRPPVVTFPVK